MRPEYAVDRQDFPYYAVELVAAGKGALTIHDKTHPLTAGSVFAYGPRTPHAIRNLAENGMRKYYLDFVGAQATQLLRSAGLKSGSKNYSVVTVGRLHELTDVFEMLLREASDNGSLTPDIGESLVRLLFLKIRQLRLPQDSAMPQAYATYERVRRHVEEHFLVLHTAQAVADQCDITPVYLSRLFKRFSDCGAYQYLLRRKLNYAAGLLMNEGLLVKEVAERLEFADAFQFSRAFKRVYGIPPIMLAKRGR